VDYIIYGTDLIMIISLLWALQRCCVGNKCFLKNVENLEEFMQKDFG
jgi:hypothetical protein